VKPVSETTWQKIRGVVNRTSTTHQELKEKLILNVVVPKFVTKIATEFRNVMDIFLTHNCPFEMS